MEGGTRGRGSPIYDLDSNITFPDVTLQFTVVHVEECHVYIRLCPTLHLSAAKFSTDYRRYKYPYPDC